MISNAILYATVSMVAFGIQMAALKGVVQAHGALKAIVVRNIVAVSALLLAMIVLQPVFSFSFGSLLLGIVIAVAGYFPFMFYTHALELGTVGVMTAVSKGRIIVSSVFGFLLLGDLFSFEKVFAVGTIFLGIIVATVNVRDFRNSDFFSWKSGVPLALLAAFGWGIILPLFSFPSEALGALFFSLMVEGIVLLGAITHLAIKKESLFPKLPIFKMSSREIFLILLTGISTAVGTVFMNLGYETGEISIVSGVTGAAVIVATIGAAFLYKERLVLKQYAGIGIVLLGIVFAAMMS